ncbi:hypothetical protein HIM_08391 [Hirsutella minnesotensis 3608]|uniref:Uncharacterized protein n=1 Tax=Hirsutella minnesotensis 3608 TaxID=1043627 RepID=A0A0F8A3Q7_9HYPO|nr:hypothetical protein HIM_08391 [Hirsutella minnesotensis 3608]
MSWNYLAATKYDFNPSIQVELRRRNRIKWAVTKRLKQSFLPQMSEELCQMVAGYILCEMAAIALHERAKDVQPATCTIDLTQDVYATYIDIEGILYLQSLRNTPLQDKGSSRCIYDAQQARAIRTIYIEYDHLGIRGIYFDAPNREGLSSRDCCGVWWTAVARESRLLRITTKSDGMKLRRLVDTIDSMAASSPPLPVYGWPTPQLVCKVIDLDTCEIAKNSSGSLRMSSLDCNAQLTTGYSVAISGFRISKICAHRWDTSASLHNDLDSSSNCTLWMYMPIDENEFLSQIWAIRHPECGLAGLMFRTNLDRKVLFGRYIVHPKFRIQSHLIYSTTNSPSRIYFNEWDPFDDEKCIKYIGIKSDAAETDRATNQRLKMSESLCPLPLTPTSKPPYTQYNEPWHYTNCVLENVAEIACCVDGTVAHRPIIGMMVYYDDGHRACIGQYRLDWVLDKSPVDRSMLLRLGLAKTRKNLPYVATITLGNPITPVSKSLSWMDVPWHGKLEWWFSQRQCRLCHCD